MKLLLAAALLAPLPLADRSPPAAHHPKAKATHPPRTEAANKAEPDQPSKDFFHPSETRSTGSVTVGGQPIAYDAVAGTLVVHAKDWEDTDAARGRRGDKPDDKDKNAPKPEASMFYTAYFKQGVPTATPTDHLPVQRRPRLLDRVAAHGRVRPGPRRHRRRAAHARRLIRSSTTTRACSTPADLVFIDAPGTGFSRIAGKDKEKAFYGVDQDIDAFTEFITQFLTKYGRWNSPKYVFGESYGTMRGAGLALVAAESGRRPQRRDPAVGHPQLGLHARRPAAQPGHRHALHRRAADLCGDRLVFQQGAEPAGRPCSAFLDAGRSSSRPAITRRR